MEGKADVKQDANTAKARGLRRAFAVIGIFTWVICLAVGFNTFLTWETTPGVQGGQPTSTPVKTDTNKWQIVMVAHTECPCTRASFVNLEKLLIRYPSQLTCSVVFCGPNANPSSNSENVKYAQRLKGAAIKFLSEDEVQAQYESATSGQVFLYSPSGDLTFKGGITNGRGHEGASEGTMAIGDLIEQRKAPAASPVYGCPLQSPRSNR
ncbi:MAG: hypothetical protein KF784_11450 [Fimbriimonadaceae bacterium]|nr:hypothetical protein [Fimbriimonadaceae bacterium]